MNIKILAIVFMLATSVTLNAQTHFGFGLKKDLFCVSLNPEKAVDATFNVDKVDVSVLLNEHFRIGLGVQLGKIVNHDGKRYEQGAGLSLNLAYLFDFKDYKDFAIAPTFSVDNSFKDFKSFKNIDVDLGVRTYIMKSMFLGTGVRYAQWNHSDIVNDKNCYSWYWEMGFQLIISNKPKPTNRNNSEMSEPCAKNAKR